jgi:hypothetical protein
VVKGPASTSVRYLSGQALVTVNDGLLTVGNGPIAANNKVCFIEVYPVLANLPGATLAYTAGAGTMTITWSGPSILQEAASITGPWTDVAGNPRGSYTTSTAVGEKFYRAIIP